MKSLKEIKVPLPRGTNAEIRKSVEKAEADLRENFADIENTIGKAELSLGEIGAVERDIPSGMSLSSGAWKTVALIRLEKGTYIIQGGVAFSSNQTGLRRVSISGARDIDQAYQRGLGDSKGAVSGALTYTNTTAVLELSGGITLYLNAYQNSGSALTTYAWLRAVRIK